MICQSENTDAVSLSDSQTDLDGAFLLQVEDSLGYLVPPPGALGRGDAVTLVVHEAADLGEVAISLDKVVNDGRLAQTESLNESG